MALGPRHDRIISATLHRRRSTSCVSDTGSTRGRGRKGQDAAHVLAAWMLESWACLPVCLSPVPVSAKRHGISSCLLSRPAQLHASFVAGPTYS